MPRISADRRRIEVEPDREALERARELGRRRTEIDVEFSRVLRRILETRSFLVEDCGSIEEFGTGLGLTFRTTRRLLDASFALDEAAAGLPVGAVVRSDGGTPTVADAILAGAASLSQATLAGRLVRRPSLLREGEDPVRIALTQPLRSVVALIRAREEESAQQAPVVPVTFAVTEDARQAFARARTVASNRAGTLLTDGETFTLVVQDYLDRHDPLRRGEGKRLVPDTKGLPGKRYVPSAVQRDVRLRSSDRCEVPACPHERHLEFAHIRDHRGGGSRESDNLLLLCSRHHLLLDSGRIVFDGWDDGRATFRRSRGGPRLSETPGLLREDDVAVRADGAHPSVGDSAGLALEGPATGQVGAVPAASRRATVRDVPRSGEVAERPPPYGSAVPSVCAAGGAWVLGPDPPETGRVGSRSARAHFFVPS